MQTEFKHLTEEQEVNGDTINEDNRKLMKMVTDLQTQKEELKRIADGKGNLVKELEAIN